MIVDNQARVSVSGVDGFDVRQFTVDQAMSRLFRIEVLALSRNLDVDFDEVIGNEARFDLGTRSSTQTWTGICSEIEQIRTDSQGLAMYRLVVVPSAWLLGQRKNRRIFQYMSELDIVLRLLGEWQIEHVVRADRSIHKPRKFRVQFGETDLDFMCRMLEDAAISFHFDAVEGRSRLVLDDEPQSRELTHPGLRFHDRPGVADGQFVTHVEAAARLRPGAMSIQDLDYRRPSTGQPRLSSSDGLPQEATLEQFDYEPGAFLYQVAGGGVTPTADSRGSTRTDEAAGARKTKNRLLSRRQGSKLVSLESSVLELAPGSLLSVVGHPHRAVASEPSLLVTSAHIEGQHDGDWRTRVEAVSARVPYRPAQVTPKPLALGLESATVVGTPGEEIDTDEYARVRVHFHWDRESARDHHSSCWIPTNQPWAGQGFGAVNIPRIGQEVLIEFLGGDPDRPVVIGRVFTETNPVPAPLPRYSHVSGIMSESTPRLVMGAADGSGAAPATSPHGGTPLSREALAQLVGEDGPFRAASPTGSMHGWHGSGVQLDDWTGSEIHYIQAERDLHFIVKNSWTSLVGNHRATLVGTDDFLQVRGDQSVTILQDQTTNITGEQTVVVRRDRIDRVGLRWEQNVLENIDMSSTGGRVVHLARLGIKWKTDQTIRLKVKGSAITITESEIKIESGGDNVAINPTSG